MFTFWILVSVLCVCLGIKWSTKLQISKYTPKGDCFLSLLKNYNQRLKSCFPLFMISQIWNPAYKNVNGWLVEGMLGWALHVSKSKPGARDGYRNPVFNRSRAKLWKTGVSISSDVNGSAIGTGEINKTHIYYCYIYTLSCKFYLTRVACCFYIDSY